MTSPFVVLTDTDETTQQPMTGSDQGPPRPGPRPGGAPAAAQWTSGDLVGGDPARHPVHLLVLLVAQGLARLPLVPVPAATSFQSIDAGEVADQIAELAGGPPSGLVPDLGGPQVRTAAGLLRAVLVFYLGVELLVGAWAAGRPRWFYDDFPWPGHPWVGPPAYREHLIGDFGGMNLATAVVFGVAAATLDRRLATTALVAYLVFAVPHLAFHLNHLGPFGTVDAVAQPAALVVLAVLPLLLLALVGRDNTGHLRRHPVGNLDPRAALVGGTAAAEPAGRPDHRSASSMTPGTLRCGMGRAATGRRRWDSRPGRSGWRTRRGTHTGGAGLTSRARRGPGQSTGTVR